MAISRMAINNEDTKLTSDNTEHMIFSNTIDPSTSGFITFQVVCQRLSDGATKTWGYRVGFKRAGSSSPEVYSELLGSILGATGDKLNLVLATVTITTDSQNLYFNVKGLSSTDIIWYARMDGYSVVNT